ncbi:MAG: ABC transporter permease, partial [Candidatus Bathyarchaeota archaeon]
MATRNISRRKSRNVLTIFAIVLGTALLVGVNVATTSAMAEYRRYLSRFWGETDIFIRYVGNAPFDVGNTTILNEFPAVEKHSSRLTSIPRQQTIFVNNDTSHVAGVVGIASDDFEYATYNITGSRTVNGPNVVVGNELAEDYGIEIDDVFHLTVESESERKNYTLQAIGIYHPTPPTESIDVFMDFEKAEELTGLEGKVSLVLVKIEDPGEVVETRDLLQDRFGLEFEVLAPKIEAIQNIQTQLAGFQLGLNMMTAVALLVCGFLVFNTMFMAVKERTYEIGVLRAVGTSRRHVFYVFIAESLLLGVIGTVVGILAGLALSTLFAFMIGQLFGELQGYRIASLTLTQDSVIIGFIGGLLAVVSGAAYPALSASRVNILQALRPEMRVKRKIPDSILLVASLLLFSLGVAQGFGILPFSIPFVDMFFVPLGLVMFAAVSLRKASKVLAAPVMLLTSSIGLLLSKSMTRRLLRNAVAFGMIGISLAFTIMMGGIRAGTSDAFESGIEEALGADIILISNQSLPLDFKDNLTSLEPERIQSMTPMGTYWLGTRVFNGENQSIVGVVVIEPETFSDITEYQFVDSPQPEEVFSKLSSSNESLILPEGLAEKLGVSVGSNLTAVTMHGPKNFTVEGIFTGAALQFISFGLQPMSESIIVSFQSESRYFYGTNKAFLFFVDLKEAHKEQALDIVESVDSEYPQFNLAEQSTTLQELLASVRTQIDQIFSIFSLMLYFVIFIST